MRRPSEPRWTATPPPPRSWRSLFKWGDPTQYKHPNHRLVATLKELFGLTDADLQRPQDTGTQRMDVELPGHLPTPHMEALRSIVGEENTFCDTYTRLSVSYGKTMLDILRLRSQVVENLPDLVLHPRHEEDVERIVAY